MPTKSRSVDGRSGSFDENHEPPPAFLAWFFVDDLTQGFVGVLVLVSEAELQSGLSVMTSIVPRTNFFVPAFNCLKVCEVVDGFLLPLDEGHFGRLQPAAMAGPATNTRIRDNAASRAVKHRMNIDGPSELPTGK